MHAVNVYADIEESSSNCRIGIWKQGFYTHKYLNLQERASVAFSRIGRNMQRASVFNHYFIVQSEMEDHFDKKRLYVPGQQISITPIHQGCSLL